MMMSALWRFLPYVVHIVERPTGGPKFEGQKLKWAIIVCDREYSLLFTSWLKRKPSPAQIRAFAYDTGNAGMDSSTQLPTCWLYDDGCSPRLGSTQWAAYADRLRALSRLECLHYKYWGSESERDYYESLDRWQNWARH